MPTLYCDAKLKRWYSMTEDLNRSISNFSAVKYLTVYISQKLIQFKSAIEYYSQLCYIESIESTHLSSLLQYLIINDAVSGFVMIVVVVLIRGLSEFLPPIGNSDSSKYICQHTTECY